MWRMNSSCGKRDGDRISFATARLISSYTRCSSSSVYLIPLVSCAFVFAVPERAVSRHRGQLCRDGVFAVRVAIRLQYHGAGAGVVLPELDEVAARIAAVRGGAALHALIEVTHCRSSSEAMSPSCNSFALCLSHATIGIAISIVPMYACNRVTCSFSFAMRS